MEEWNVYEIKTKLKSFEVNIVSRVRLPILQILPALGIPEDSEY